jgi:hypothetical protein
MHAKLVPQVFLARWLNRTLSHSKSVGNDAAKKNSAVAQSLQKMKQIKSVN